MSVHFVFIEDSVMKISWVSAVGLLGVAAPLFCQEPVPSTSLLVRIHQGAVLESEQPPNEWTNCIVIGLQGNVYVEKKTHVIGESTADVKAFSGDLTVTQLGGLKTILANDAWNSAAVPGPRRMPYDESDFRWITAEVRRGASLQEVDYRYWKRHTEEYNDVPQSFVATQRNNLRILAPLMNWVQTIDLKGLAQVDAVPGMCTAGP